jgi:hypothetical protein
MTKWASGASGIGGWWYCRADRKLHTQYFISTTLIQPSTFFANESTATAGYFSNCRPKRYAVGQH